MDKATDRPDAARRLLRALPLLAFSACYLMVNFVYGLWPRALNEVRLPLAAWTLGAAACLCPALCPPRMGRGWVFLASMASVAGALYLVPVWIGHGCWSPDQVALGSMFLLGGGLALVACLRLPGALAAMSRHAAPKLAAVLVLAILTTIVWAWPRTSLRSNPWPTGGMSAGEVRLPSVAWPVRSWSDIAVKLLPALARSEPLCPALYPMPQGGALRVLADRAEVWNAAGGSLRGEFALHERPDWATDAPGFVWQGISVAGDFVALQGHTWVDLYDLASGRFIVRAEEVWPGSSLAFAGGLLVVRGETVQGLGPSGAVLWEVALPRPSGLPELRQVSTYGPQEGGRTSRVRLVRLGDAYAAVGEGGVLAFDRDGREIWRLERWMLEPAALVSPDGSTLYLAGLVPQGQGPEVLACGGGRELWHIRLPGNTFVYHWAATPLGLAVGYETVEEPPTADPTAPARRGGELCLLSQQTGGVVWRQARAVSLAEGLHALGGDLLLTSFEGVTRVAGESGDGIWSLTTLGTEYYREPLLVGGLLVLQGNGLLAVEADSGRALWGYQPAGAGARVVTDGESLFVASSRGMAVLRMP